MDKDFLLYLECLYKAETVECKFKQLESYIEQLGFEGLLYTFIPSLSGNMQYPDFIPVYMTSRYFNQGYLSHYAEAEFSRCDPFITAVASGEKLSIDWWNRHRITPYDGEALQVIEVARYDYNVRNGITIPLHASDIGIAGATLISPEKDTEFHQLTQTHLHEAEIACHLFHEHLSSNQKWHKPFLLPITEQISASEYKVLKFLIRGGAVKQLASIGVSERYGYNLTRKLRTRFGFSSNEQMVHRLTRLGITELFE